MGDGLFDIPRYEPERIEKLPEKKSRNSFLEKAKERAAKRRLQEPLPEKEPEKRKTKAEPVNDIKTEVENLSINRDEEDIKTEIIEENHEPEEPEDFKIFDNIQAQKKKRLAASFPRWCENPEVIDGDFTNLPPLEELHEFLDETIYKNLEAMNFTTVFPVQRAIIPELLKRGPPRDLAVQAPTGSGKTITFLVPIVQKLMQRAIPAIRALIVLPTRELAKQVYDVMLELIKDTKLTGMIIGGATSLEQECNKLIQTIGGKKYATCDIIIATPGRLMDHLDSGMDLTRLRYLVVDEADRMRGAWLEKLEQKTNRALVQKLLFSATLASDPQFLSSLKLRFPKLYTSGWTQPAGLTEEMIRYGRLDEKPRIIRSLIKEDTRALIFVNSNESAVALDKLLKKSGMRSESIAGALENWQRTNAIKKFKKGKISAIICTDVVARGLDLDCCNTVINYDVALSAATHVHRSGRTARAGSAGVCITLCQLKHKPYFFMMKELGRTFIQRSSKLELKEEPMEE
ncbi:Oidioi.mRNA.OKI2018_I69.chr1.g3599.t1.cds [Oikopleura dioica]|uniref:ATP-dependent RNA helicase n=1 Tax=Oikopleura dioica TaxID=34765 RepID=A0ABN7T053_OIKDI|nr:Oidioi.mRNA.OKI2018_I69.chr1.g3599.t1.cds [Oikopleura dioica]